MLTQYQNNQNPLTRMNQPDFQEIGFHVLASGDPIIEDCPERYTSQTHFVELLEVSGEPASIADIVRLLMTAMVPAPCWCEHDCCGHWHGDASVTPLTINRYEVTTHLARNY